MLPFSTEFPVAGQKTREGFIAEVLAWLQGTQYSDVLKLRDSDELSGENVHLKANSGEELRIRELRDTGSVPAIGFRHDFPDAAQRLWRTECVLRWSGRSEEQAIIRLRTQCIARSPGAVLENPRKPYIVKSMLKDSWGGSDGIFRVKDQPIWLQDDDEGLAVARHVTNGDSSSYLPVVYVSATGNKQWSLNRETIGRLAYDLGGVAHVVVEPNRGFSFKLRELTNGSNAYGGAVGLSVPGQGIVRRRYPAWQLTTDTQLSGQIVSAAFKQRAQMPSFGWDWTELQEQALRAQRDRDRNRLSAEESEQLYEEEIANLKERVKELVFSA